MVRTLAFSLSDTGAMGGFLQRSFIIPSEVNGGWRGGSESGCRRTTEEASSVIQTQDAGAWAEAGASGVGFRGVSEQRLRGRPSSGWQAQEESEMTWASGCSPGHAVALSENQEESHLGMWRWYSGFEASAKGSSQRRLEVYGLRERKQRRGP